MKTSFKSSITLFGVVFLLVVASFTGCADIPNATSDPDAFKEQSTSTTSIQQNEPDNRHYVDSAATGNSNGSSWADAWKSISNIDWSKISAGDIIYISGGTASKTYNGKLNIGKSGDPNSPITITKGKDPGHSGEVILDGQNLIARQVEIISCSNIVVSELTLNNPATQGCGVYIDASDHITIDSCVIPDSRRAGIFIQESSNCILSNNYITTPKDIKEQTDGIYSQRNTACIYTGNRIVILNSDADGHDDIIQSYQDSDLSICNNYGEQNNAKTENAQGIYLTSMRGGIFYIYNNVINAPNTYNSLICMKLHEKEYKAIIVSNTLIGSKWDSLKVQNVNGGSVMNNIIWGYNDGSALFTTGICVVENNWYKEDPKLGEDFIPLSGSPVKNAGANLKSLFVFNPEDYPTEIKVKEEEVKYASNLPENTIQAEDGILTEPMKKLPLDAASCGSYIMSTTNNEQAKAVFNFEIPEDGKYQVKIGVYTDDPGSDSYFVVIDDGAEFIWDLNPSGTGYGKWREVSIGNRGSGTDLDPEFNPYFIDLKAGAHTITFRNRERYAKLDYFYFVKTE